MVARPRLYCPGEHPERGSPGDKWDSQCPNLWKTFVDVMKFRQIYQLNFWVDTVWKARCILRPGSTSASLRWIRATIKLGGSQSNLHAWVPVLTRVPRTTIDENEGVIKVRPHTANYNTGPNGRGVAFKPVTTNVICCICLQKRELRIPTRWSLRVFKPKIN